MRTAASVAASAEHPEPSSLDDYIDIVGGSGRAYRFSRMRAGFPLSPVGGAYLLARHEGARLELVYIAAAESLLREAAQLWDQVAERFQANQLFSRLNISGRSRACESADILAAHSLATEWEEPQAQRAAA